MNNGAALPRYLLLLGAEPHLHLPPAPAGFAPIGGYFFC
jgi:hypothetical protein